MRNDTPARAVTVSTRDDVSWSTRRSARCSTTYERRTASWRWTQGPRVLTRAGSGGEVVAPDITCSGTDPRHPRRLAESTAVATPPRRSERGLTKKGRNPSACKPGSVEAADTASDGHLSRDAVARAL